jgi:HJR/Mrr/RecB family endonuclease
MSLLESYSLETGEEFEDYVGGSLYDSGYSVRKTKQSWDGGCDLVAKSGDDVILCQVKQVRSDKVLAQGVEEIVAAQARYSSKKPTKLVLITNAKSMTSGQIRLAKNNNVLILNGNDLEHYGSALREKSA